MSNKKVVFLFLLPVLLSFILHFHVFKLDVMGYHVWRQSQTQTVIYNFTFSDNSIFNPQRFDLTTGTATLLYEFPLYQWLIAQVNNALGYSVMHTRTMSFVFFIFLLLGFYRLLIKFVSKQIALISNSLICFSPLLYYYCVNPLPDILALGFSVWCLHFFFEFISSGKWAKFLLFCFFLMLATLVKLPYVLFGGVFILYAYKEFVKKNFRDLGLKSLLFVTFLVPSAAWYLKAIPTWSTNPIMKGLLANDKTLFYLLDCFQFNLISSVPELLTNYASCLFLVTGIYLFFKQKARLKEPQQYFMVLFVSFSFYFLFELNTIEKVHDYYLMPFIPLIFLVVTYGLRFLYEGKYRQIVFFLVCLVPFTAWLRIDQRWNEENPGFVKDYLTEQNFFKEIIPFNAACIIDYDDSKAISLYYLKRNGYSLSKNELSPSVLKDRFMRGADYLVTENLKINLNDYKEFSFKELYKNELKIYKLSLK